MNLPVEMYADGLVKPFPAYAWLGGYPLIYFDLGGNILCADCATKQYEMETWGESCMPILIGYDVYWEGPTLRCEECNVDIESAYGEPTERLEL